MLITSKEGISVYIAKKALLRNYVWRVMSKKFILTNVGLPLATNIDLKFHIDDTHLKRSKCKKCNAAFSGKLQLETLLKYKHLDGFSYSYLSNKRRPSNKRRHVQFLENL